MKIAKITRVVLAGGMAAAALAVAAPHAEADLEAGRTGTQIMTCTGSNTIASLNPTVKDGTQALYAKVTMKKSDGTKTFFSVPIPVDATTCTVDAGIATTQGAQDVKYLYDNQTSGQTTLTLASAAGALIGSNACDAAAIGSFADYPYGYPINGKITYKYNQVDAALKQLSTQIYQRSYADPDEANPAIQYSVGIVIKGVAVGSHMTNTTTFLPTDSTKNINFTSGCSDAVPNNAAIAEVWAFQTDGVDADALDDKMMFTLGADDANAQP